MKSASLTSSSDLKRVKIFNTLALTIFIALSACKVNSSFEFRSDGSMHSEMVFEDSNDSMRQLKGNCDQLKRYLGPLGKFMVDVIATDITRPGGHLTCKLTSNTPFDNVKLVKNGKMYTVKLEKPLETGGDDDEEVETTFKFIMPGKIVHASRGGVIRDNTVTYKGINSIENGFTIVAKDDASEATRQTEAKEGKRLEGIEDDNVPVWVWILSGLASLGIVVGIVTIAVKQKRARRAGINGNRGC